MKISKSNIVIVDYNMGNIRSISNKLNRFNTVVYISNDIKVLKTADKIILPGVGHFNRAMENLRNLNLLDVLNEKILIQGIPILGICLGMQLMAKCSEEGNVEGLGWIDAEIVRFKVKNLLKYKVPHIGWNTAEILKPSILFSGIPQGASYYFVHAYHMKCYDKEDTLTTTNYEYSFTSSIQRNNIFGTQFHPEKSHKSGEDLLKNFINI